MKMGEKTGMAVWDPVEIGQKQCAAWRFAPRRIYVERLAIEWHVLSLPGGEGDGTTASFLIERAEKPVSSAWRHYLIQEMSPVQPIPVLPDRPLVIRPDRPLTILPGESALFFLEIPVWFRLDASGDQTVRIFEEPLMILSNTWFGDPVNGELCYGLDIRLHQRIGTIEPCAYLAVCPLYLTNDSNEDLPFEKICLHAENLSVFRSRERLWTNRLNVIFKGPDQATQIQILNAFPDFEEGITLASGARQPAEGWGIRKTFSMLKYFAEF
jgi:hypothetical protein